MPRQPGTATAPGIQQCQHTEVTGKHHINARTTRSNNSSRYTAMPEHQEQQVVTGKQHRNASSTRNNNSSIAMPAHQEQQVVTGKQVSNARTTRKSNSSRYTAMPEHQKQQFCNR
jgi:hypothetical protein